MQDEEVLGKAYDGRLMRRLMAYLRPYWLQALIALVAIVANSVLQLAQPWLTKLAIDRHISVGDLEGLGTIAIVFLMVLAGSFALEFVQTLTMQMTGQRIMYDIRMEVYGHLQRLDLRYYDRNPVGRLMTRVTSDVDVLNDLFSSGVVSVFGDVFTLFGIMVVLVAMDWRLAIVAFAVLPLIVMITQWFRRHVRETYRTVRTWIARINAFLQEHITGMATVQLFRRERASFEAFDAVNARHRDANIDSLFYYAVFYPAIEFIGALASASIIWWGGGWVGEGTLTLGALVAFLQYSQRFFRPISDLSEKFNVLQAAMASSERIFALLDTPVSVASPVRPVAPLPPPGLVRTLETVPTVTAGLERSIRTDDATAGRVVFEHVSFAYREGDLVLRDVSFEVAPGERVAIVGATGAGKSTIINLLMRFYDVTEGRILVDGVDVRDYDLHELRRRFSLVLQDVHLFSGTIAANIRLGRDDISHEDIVRAAEAVHAAAFIARLPAGYDTQVAERGATLSVGQKQLLSFARALAFDPAVLVLDEATSSIDTDTERLIRDALRVLMAGRSTLAIAHRLSTIQDMDKILVMHKGRLREAGTHQALLAARGIYHRLYQLQYKDQEVDSVSA